MERLTHPKLDHRRGDCRSRAGGDAGLHGLFRDRPAASRPAWIGKRNFDRDDGRGGSDPCGAMGTDPPAWPRPACADPVGRADRCPRNGRHHVRQRPLRNRPRLWPHQSWIRLDAPRIHSRREPCRTIVGTGRSRGGHHRRQWLRLCPRTGDRHAALRRRSPFSVRCRRSSVDRPAAMGSRAAKSRPSTARADEASREGRTRYRQPASPHRTSASPGSGHSPSASPR